MDSSSIKEIADQLGVGVDYLIAHLTEFAPSWSRMCVARESACCLTCAAVIVVFTLAGVIAYRSDFNEDDKAFVLIICFLMVTAAIVFFGLSARSIAMHMAAPDAALVYDMLKAVR